MQAEAPAAEPSLNPTIRDLLAEQRRSQESNFVQQHREVSFQPGDRVSVSAALFKDHQGHGSKFQFRRIGPLTVVRRIGTDLYEVALPPLYRRMHPIFHVSRLLPWFEQHGVGQPPALPVDADREGYTIEAIIDERKSRRALQYRVRWRGLTAAYDTWEPMEELQGAILLIRHFRNRNPPKSAAVDLLRMTNPL
jgi:hypothetical protein